MWRKVIMAGTNKIATNKWIKDNLFIGYSIPGGQENNCPTKSEISKNSQNLISFKGGENNQCMTQENLVTGVNTKSIIFTYSNPGGLGYESLALFTHKDERVISWIPFRSNGNYNPPNDKGDHSYTLSLPIKDKSLKLGVHLNRDEWADTGDKIYVDGIYLGRYYTKEGIDIFFTWNYNEWLGRASSITIKVIDD